MTQKTAEYRLPGDPTAREVVERTIRVDHAGEYGAKRIYEGQLAVLGRTKYGPLIEHMVAGFALGAATALLGHRGAMACTVAVEEAIDEHYRAQEDTLGDDEAELRADIARFRAEELEHRDTGLEHEAEQAPAYRLLSAAIKTGCKIAIKISERV